MADYVDVHFLKLYEIYGVFIQKNRIPMKSINKTNQNYRKYSQFGKTVQGKHYLRGQIWGQANFRSQAKNLFGANFETKIEPRPLGQWDQASSGQDL